MVAPHAAEGGLTASMLKERVVSAIVVNPKPEKNGRNRET